MTPLESFWWGVCFGVMLGSGLGILLAVNFAR